MPIYNGSTNVRPMKVSNAYVGDQLVYRKNDVTPFTISSVNGTSTVYLTTLYGESGLPKPLDVWYRILDMEKWEYGEWQPWLQGSGTSSTITLQESQSMQVWNKNDRLSMGGLYAGAVRFIFTGAVDVGGSLISLINYRDTKEWAFCRLFSGQSAIWVCSLEFPEKLAAHCYDYMFYECENLEKMGSILPAKEVPDAAYNGMFASCYKLAEPPRIYAEKIGVEGCRGMFNWCRAIKITDVKPEEYDEPFFVCPTDLGTNAVQYMFKNSGGSYTDDPVAGKSYYTYW